MIAILIVCFLVIAGLIACVWWIDRAEYRAQQRKWNVAEQEATAYLENWPIGPTPEELAEIEASEHPRKTDAGC